MRGGGVPFESNPPHGNHQSHLVVIKHVKRYKPFTEVSFRQHKNANDTIKEKRVEIVYVFNRLRNFAAKTKLGKYG